MSNNIRFITRDGEKSLSPSSLTSSLKALQLKNPISSSYAEEEDTLQLKQGLNKLGYYEVPPYGMTPYADSAMIDSIKKLQQDANLTVDGKVNPDGETLSEINKRLGQNSYKTALEPFVVTKEYKDKTAEVESRGLGDYKARSEEGEGIGALGRYQMRGIALRETGHMDRNYRWTGKDNIHSTQDFINNPQAQEKIMDEFTQRQDRQYRVRKDYDHIGKKVKLSDGSVVELGQENLLAAAHKEGTGFMNGFIKNLELNPDGSYSLNQQFKNEKKDKLPDIERRLKRHAK